MYGKKHKKGGTKLSKLLKKPKHRESKMPKMPTKKQLFMQQEMMND